MQNQEKIAFRMDDVGASSKQFEVYGNDYIYLFGKGLRVSPISHYLFLKYCPPFKKWGPYRELNVSEWSNIFELLNRYHLAMTVGITAGWVERDGTIVPFPEKFPDQAQILKEGLQSELIEIANHGLTHCVVGKHLPRGFSSNRSFHREFWDWLPEDIHKMHLKRSQDILMKFFNADIITFVPPGNVWSASTEIFAAANGIKFISTHKDKCKTYMRRNKLVFLSDENVVAFHDRDIVMNGVDWLEKQILKYKNYRITTVKGYLENE